VTVPDPSEQQPSEQQPSEHRPPRPWEDGVLVVCSLEPWGEVRRRLQLLVDELARTRPRLRILFVEPALDVPHTLRHRRWSELRRTRPPSPSGVSVVQPRKWWPRVLGPFADRSLVRQVRRAARRNSSRTPVLWVNDAHYARLVADTGWPSLYDITDDWTEASQTRREVARLRADEGILLDRCGAVVVCSPALAASRGRMRPVELIPNAVDVELFQHPQPRPGDLPAGPCAVYVGSLHDDRIDVELCCDLAAAQPAAHLVLVGPDSLSAPSRRRLAALGNIVLLGPQPYRKVPAYLQHAHLVVVPHVVTPFTESLDPIKAYECAAVGRPTLATAVPGFAGTAPLVEVVDRDRFVARAREHLAGPARPSQPGVVPTWAERAESMAAVIDTVAGPATPFRPAIP
jgi:glycosyltransferase involved in cell wall biosynthesis